MRRLLLGLALLLVPAVARPQAAAPSPPPAPPPPQLEAGDTAELERDVGPLKDRIPPVARHVFLLKQRWELVPSVAFSFRDPFFTKYVFELSLTYNFDETMGVMARAGYAADAVSGSAQICTTGSTAGCRSPTYDELNGKATGQIKFLGALDFQWTPIYGKFNLFGEWVVHFDLYGILGPAFLTYAGPPSAGQPGSSSVFTAGGEVGIGMRFFFNKFMALRLELRDDIYGERSPTVSGGTTVQNQLFIDVGLGFFFPTTFHDG
ncbi:MAG TPA: outer membrane beta-barrel domain-containing protein [Myxococcaceae bacterium]|nr:outer membrane beta-barrel domain-containing protein [Myxococcaceae bacterium]